MMLLSNLASYLLAAVLAAGIVLTVARWQRCPRISLLVVIALGLPLLLDFGLSCAQRMPAAWGWLQRMTPAERRLTFSIEQALGQAARAASYVLLLVAAFSRPEDEKSELQHGVPGRETGRVRPAGLLQRWWSGRGFSSDR